MKTKTKMIIALSLAGVITLGAVIALVVVIASFNATAGSGLSVSYVAKNVEAEVSMGYAVFDSVPHYEGGGPECYPNEVTYTTVQAGSDEKLTFSSSDTTEAVSKSFDELDEIKLTKDGYVYLKYTFKHTGTTANSGNYLNVTLVNTFSELNNIKIEYFLGNTDSSNTYYDENEYLVDWMDGVNGITVTRDTDNECVLYARIFVDVKTQDAVLDGSIVFNMTTSDTDYYANLVQHAMSFDLNATSLVIGTYTAEHLSAIDGITTISLSADGSGPINKYQLADGSTYILSDAEIYTTSCKVLFAGCENLKSIDIGSLNTKYNTTMQAMFSECKNLLNLDLSGFETSNVTDMAAMFSYCTSLTSLDVSPLDTSNVTDMSSMFYRCSSITSLDLSSFDTSKVTEMACLFLTCSAIKTIDLSGVDTSNVTDMHSMFNNCSNLTTVYVDASWSTAKVPSSSTLFSSCTALVGGNGTVFDSTQTKVAYARIDTAETPGYFTLKTT